MNAPRAGNIAGRGQVFQCGIATVNEMSAAQKVDSPCEGAAALGHEIQVDIPACIRFSAVDGLDHPCEGFELFLDPVLNLLIKRTMSVFIVVVVLQVFLRGQNKGLV